MKTSQQREEAFRADLAELLKKHNAEMNVTDDGSPWGMHVGICQVWMSPEWDADGNQIADYTEFKL